MRIRDVVMARKGRRGWLSARRENVIKRIKIELGMWARETCQVVNKRLAVIATVARSVATATAHPHHLNCAVRAICTAR
jgi:hypothetical protein